MCCKPLFETEKGFCGYNSMIVLNPNNTTHQLKVVPRFYPSGTVDVLLRNEATDENETQEVVPVVLDGYMYIELHGEYENNTNLQLTIMQETECVYRGKIFVTDQADNTQGYEISKDIFII